MTFETLHETNAAWRIVSDVWRCPGCDRTKGGIVRVARSGRTVAKIVEHHCHSCEYPHHFIKPYRASLPVTAVMFAEENVKALIRRFPDALVCEDCNNIDPVAKRLVGASPYFSFSPDEIRSFITATDHQKHVLNEEAARQIYGEAFVAFAEVMEAADYLLGLVVSGRLGCAGKRYINRELAEAAAQARGHGDAA